MLLEAGDGERLLVGGGPAEELQHVLPQQHLQHLAVPAGVLQQRAEGAGQAPHPLLQIAGAALQDQGVLQLGGGAGAEHKATTLRGYDWVRGQGSQVTCCRPSWSSFTGDAHWDPSSGAGCFTSTSWVRLATPLSRRATSCLRAVQL